MTEHGDAAFRWKVRSQQLVASLGLLTIFPDDDDSNQTSALRAIDFDGCQYIVMQSFLDPWSEIRKDAFTTSLPMAQARYIGLKPRVFVDLLLPLTVSGSAVEGNWAAASPVAGAATTQRIAVEKE